MNPGGNCRVIQGCQHDDAFNAEVAARLQASIEQEESGVPAFLQKAEVPVTILHLHIEPGTTVADVQKALSAAVDLLPRETKVVTS